MKPEKYILRKPVVLEAMQFTEESKNKVYGWVLGSDKNTPYPTTESNGDHTLGVQTESELFKLNIGDWLVLGVTGKFFKLTNEEFLTKYMPSNWSRIVKH